MYTVYFPMIDLQRLTLVFLLALDPHIESGEKRKSNVAVRTSIQKVFWTLKQTKFASWGTVHLPALHSTPSSLGENNYSKGAVKRKFTFLFSFELPSSRLD
jgi:hypothetical protein